MEGVKSGSRFDRDSARMKVLFFVLGLAVLAAARPDVADTTLIGK